MPQRQWRKPKMVHWYAFWELAETGFYALLSTMLGSMVDTRRFAQFEGTEAESVIDYPDAGEIWFDYAADTGDGWDATYTMAYLFSSPELGLQSGEKLPRGRFLILGGDEVYPRASKMAYAQRLVWPFNQAARNLGQYAGESKKVKSGQLRDIYCIPGNHDWYDGLAAFTRRFCNGRDVGSFRTRQRRSYFILKLPYDWQVWAVDLQLGHDIDVAQLNFFRRHAESLATGAKVILCLAEPDWVYGERSGEDLHFNLERVERMVEARGGRVVLELAGDIHNYQRYEGTRDPGGGYPSYTQTKIVSGGGGAFLHPTHSFSLGRAIYEGFTCENRYPGAGTSWWLSFKNLLFAAKNWELSILFALVYLCLFWGVPSTQITRTFPIDYPGTLLLLVLVAGVLVRFADFRHPVWKTLWGLAHAAAHMAAAYFVWLWVSAMLPPDWLYTSRLMVFAVGGVVGATLFGIYLLLSLSLFRIHENEAFSSLRIRDFKHFLRFRLTRDGLTLHVLAVEKVASERKHHPAPVKLFEKRHFR